MDIEIILKLLLAAVLGGIIGLEREISHKDTGLRSNILISVGSTLLTLISFKITHLGKNVDPAFIPGQIIIAVAILGAGIIIKERFSVMGLTTAAITWSVSAIGITIGCGFYFTAFTVTLLLLGILLGLQALTKALENQHSVYPYVIITDDRAAVLLQIKKIMRDQGINYIDSRLIKSDKGYQVEITLKTSKNKNQAFLEKAMQTPGVKEVLSEKL